MAAERPRAAIVTGGAAGIGLGIVKRLLDDGMNVLAADRNPKSCDAARSLLEGRSAHVMEADMTVEEQVREVMDEALVHFGRIDLLCNNAGVRHIAPLTDISLADWQESFRVNVDAPLLGARAVLPAMREQGGGAIVNIGSISGVAPYAEGGAYAASKAALATLTRVLAMEFGPLGIRVNCIAPGSIDRDSSGSISSSHIPVGRAGAPHDVASLVSYLASDEASYLNGAVIVLDGGATAGRTRPGR
ncbi:MAG: SDR family oxidoreductase [Chloroflexi bacterium]|nr:SDR family oxidoreductase [Chloroflexota bacterium]MYK35734.1 SDR family oxidoreductase [Chloroflexota bacterium]